ncbi:hypothetical protein HNQ07_004502 [Deinococcus metalli]|uniref:Uncharacterized protein n=1 Tax=Deinococcus metalli TaxID=1141878 RepID=A0A7W8KIZ9_9DEIO|nr:hypothetical protein [Deinococcus metalli]MBB5378992.1 hypothetical protein [Deinococcus metalli]
MDTGTVLDGSQGPVVVIVRQTTGRTRVNRSRGRPSRAAVLAEATATTDRLLAALAHARIPTLVDHQHGTMLRHRIPDVPYGLRTLMNDLGKPHSAQVQLAPVLSAWLAGGQLDAHDPDLVAACSHADVQLYWLEQVDHLVRYQEQLTDADLGRLALVGANDNPAAGDLVTADLRTLPGDRLCRVGQYVEARCAQVSARRPWYQTF